MSLEFSWKLPRTGMTHSLENIDMDYHFAYWIKEETDDSSGIGGLLCSTFMLLRNASKPYFWNTKTHIIFWLQ